MANTPIPDIKLEYIELGKLLQVKFLIDEVREEVHAILANPTSSYNRSFLENLKERFEKANNLIKSI